MVLVLLVAANMGLNLYLAPFGSFIAAFLLTFRNEGKVNVKELLKKGFDPRIGGLWYVPVFLFMPAIAGFSLLLAWLSEGTIPELMVLSQPWLILFNFVYIFFSRRAIPRRVRLERLCASSASNASHRSRHQLSAWSNMGFLAFTFKLHGSASGSSI